MIPSPDALQMADKLINDNPTLFNNDKKVQVQLTLATAMIKYYSEMKKYLEQFQSINEIQTELQSLSKIKP